LKNATITIRDGGSNYITVKIGEGNLQYTEKRTILFVKDRGTLSTVRQGEDVQMDVNFAFIWEFITAALPGIITVEDALKRRNNAAGWVSASTDTYAPYCVNIELVFIPPCITIEEEVIVFPQFHYDELAHNAKDGTVDCKGTCNSTQALVARVAQ
jgi:hypothetical protein